jgi:hypothetical protein
MAIPAMSEGIGARREADGNLHVLSIGTLVIAIWCVAPFLIPQNAWSL